MISIGLVSAVIAIDVYSLIRGNNYTSSACELTCYIFLGARRASFAWNLQKLGFYTRLVLFQPFVAGV